MNVTHKELASIFAGEVGTVEKRDPAIRPFLVKVIDNRLHLPGKRWIGAALAVVIAGFREVPEVIDHAGASEKLAFSVDGNAPGVGSSFTEQLEVACFRMDSKNRSRKVVSLTTVAD